MSTIDFDSDTRIYPELLKKGHTITIVPMGKSMMPLLDGECDCAIIKPKFGEVNINDLVLYRDKEGRLVLHRVWKKVLTEYVLLGDGNIEKEFPIAEDDIYGVCIAIKKKGRCIPTNNLKYRIYVFTWRLLYPVRYYLLKITNLIYTKNKQI